MELPQSVKATLWSYDTSALDTTRDSNRIITNVLNYGTMEAVAWLRKTYSESQISEVLSTPKSGEWNKRSLNLWSLVYKTPATPHERFVK